MSHTYLMNASTTPALVSGQVSTIEVARDAATVVFHNISVNTDILLSLGVVNPGPTSTPGGEWPYVLPAGHSLSVQVPGTSRTQTAVSTYWQGKIWVLALNQSGQQSVTGQQPSIGNLWIMTFAAGEDPADVSPASIASSQIGQQRVVAVPVGNPVQPLTFTPGAGSDTVVATYGVNAAIIAAQAVNFYLYSFSLHPLPVAAAVGIDFSVFAQAVDSVPTVLASVALGQGVAYAGPSANGTIQPFILPAAGATAVLASLIWGSGTVAALRVVVHTNSIAGAPVVKTNVQAAPDGRNPTIGNYPIGFFTSTAGLF